MIGEVQENNHESASVRTMKVVVKFETARLTFVSNSERLGINWCSVRMSAYNCVLAHLSGKLQWSQHKSEILSFGNSRWSSTALFTICKDCPVMKQNSLHVIYWRVKQVTKFIKITIFTNY